jgi:hypothetical protein
MPGRKSPLAHFYGTTTERGYGAAHRAERERRLALWQPGQPCARCGKPMYGPRSQIDLGHDHVNGGYSGLEHHHCNRSEGASRGNQARKSTPAVASGWDVTCKGCGQPYHYAARLCEVCGAHYHPSGGQVRTCGRACGQVLHRRNRMAKGWVPPELRPKPPPKPRRPGPVESGEREPAGGWPSVAITYYTCRYCGKPGVTKANARQQREVCPDRTCQLARLTANNLIVRKGMTREQADAAVLAYRAEGDHRQLRSGWQQSRRWQARRRQPSRTVTTIGQATLW